MYSVRLQFFTPTVPLPKQFAAVESVGSGGQTAAQFSCTILRRQALTFSVIFALASFFAVMELCHATQKGPSNFVGPVGRPMLTYPGTTNGSVSSHPLPMQGFHAAQGVTLGGSTQQQSLWVDIARRHQVPTLWYLNLVFAQGPDAISQVVNRQAAVRSHAHWRLLGYEYRPGPATTGAPDHHRGEGQRYQGQHRAQSIACARQGTE